MGVAVTRKSGFRLTGVGAFIELLATGPAAEPAIALGRALRSLRDGFRSAFQAPHPRPPLCEKRALYPTEPASARGSGANPDRTRAAALAQAGAQRPVCWACPAAWG